MEGEGGKWAFAGSQLPAKHDQPQEMQDFVPVTITPESFTVLVNPRLEAPACCRETLRVRAGPRAVAVGGEQAEKRTQL